MTICVKFLIVSRKAVVLQSLFCFVLFVFLGFFFFFFWGGGGGFGGEGVSWEFLLFGSGAQGYWAKIHSEIQVCTM